MAATDPNRPSPIPIRHPKKKPSRASGLPLRMMMWNPLRLLILLALCDPPLCRAASRARSNSNKNARSIAVMNESGVKIDVFWINPTTRELAESSVGGGIMYGGTTGINSYIGHSFEIQELPSKAKGTCKLAMCRKAYFTVTSDEDQVFTVHKDFHVEVQNHRTKAAEMAQRAIGECQRDVKASSQSPLEQLEAYAACLSQSINATLQAKQDEIEYEKSVRKDMGQKMGSLYACRDPNLATTQPIRNSTWSWKSPTASAIKKHDVRVMFESDANSVLVVEGFFSPTDCRLLREASVPATADDGKDESPSAIERRNVPLSAKPKVGAILAKLQQLVLDQLHTAVRYDHDPVLVLTSHAGKSDGAAECVVGGAGESSCGAAGSADSDSARHAPEMALAQLRAFCEASDDLLGGAVHYPKTGVHLNPCVGPDGGTNPLIGSAVLTLYRNPESLQREADPYVEEFVECPVRRGHLLTVVEDFLVPSAQV